MLLHKEQLSGGQCCQLHFSYVCYVYVCMCVLHAVCLLGNRARAGVEWEQWKDLGTVGLLIRDE